MYRVNSAVFGGELPHTLVVEEVAQGRYRLRRETATGDNKSVLVTILAEGPLEPVTLLYQLAKDGLMARGCPLASEWAGAGSAKHELTKYQGMLGKGLRINASAGGFPANARRIQACFKRGELAYRGDVISEDDESAVKAVLGHSALAGKVFDLLVGPSYCQLLETLSPGPSVASLYAQVPALRRLTSVLTNKHHLSSAINDLAA